MAKGSGFERDQCKEWSRWFSSGESADIFWRTEGSGGRAKNRSKSLKKKDPERAKALLKYSYGDMTFILPEGEDLIASILFEFKRGYSAGRKLSNEILDQLVYQIAKDSRKSSLTSEWRKKYANKIRAIFKKTRVTSNLISILDFVDGKEKKRPPKLLEWWINAEEEKKEAQRNQVVLVLRRDGKQPVIFVDEVFGKNLFNYCDGFNKFCYGIIKCGPYNLMYFRQEDFFKSIPPKVFLKVAEKRAMFERLNNPRKIKRRKSS